MFGHQDDNSKEQDTNDTNGGLNPGLDQTDQISSANESVAVAEADQPSGAPLTPDNDPNWQPPGTTSAEDDPEPIRDVVSPAGGYPRPTSSQLSAAGPVSSISADDEIDSDSATHELIDIKQKALDELSPLLDQLDQSPEEKFRTIMMMIQASDDQTLVKKAYAAAHSIEDEKTHAQALLDIVNEINYFTQEPQS